MYKEKVSTHYRAVDGHKYKVSSYKRKAKPRKQMGVHKAFTKRFEVVYYQDNQGRLVSRRKFKQL